MLVEIAAARAAIPARVALAWVLGRPAVTSVVIGARTPAQLIGNLAAAELRLSDDERTRLDTVSAPPVIYPYRHHVRTLAPPPTG